MMARSVEAAFLPMLRSNTIKALMLALMATSGAALLPSTADAQTNRRTVAHTGSSVIAGDMFRYTARRGDNLFTLAKHYMVRPDGWRTVQHINRIANPKAIPVGTVISIPVRLLKTDRLTAQAVAFRGNPMLVRTNGHTAPITANAQIETGSIIRSGKNSFVTLELSNGSRITLPSNSSLRITQMRRIHLNDTLDFDFLLEKGRVETNVAPLKNSGSSYRIRTPIAVSAVRGTNYRVSYDGPGSASLTEVIDGAVAVSAEQTGKSVVVQKGYGSSLSHDGEIRQSALLPAPEMLNPGRVQTDPDVSFTLSPLQGAVQYHAQLAKDAGFVDIENEQYSDKPAFTFTDVDNGRWFVRLTAISDEGMEGMPVTYAIRRVLAGISASSERSEDGGYRFRWTGEGEGERLYHFTLRADAPDAPPVLDETGLTNQLLSVSDLPAGNYIWRVGVQQFLNGDNVTNWSPEQRLVVAKEEK